MQIFNIREYKTQVGKRLKTWKEENFAHRLWERDPLLWFSEPVPEITDRLGWLDLPETMQEKLDDMTSFAEQVKTEGIRHVVLLGIGGSSLAPDVFQKTFGHSRGYPELFVLDSTHQAAVSTIAEKIDFDHTLFLVSSKSGTTLETISLFKFFWKQVSQKVDKPGAHFAAITDPGTLLVRLAQERGFRQVFYSPLDVGGRYSAFTVFGLVPAALIGMDVHRLLGRAREVAKDVLFQDSEKKASGLFLGAVLGELNQSRDKLTFLTSSSLESFPDWLEQLVAESLGKDGKGIIPVVNEPLASIDIYGKDRLFVYLSMKSEENREVEKRLNAMKSAGHPIIHINLSEKEDLGREIFLWETAVAAAGAILGIHPFNQPDVVLTKELTRRVMEKVAGRREESKEVKTVSIYDTESLISALKDWIGQAEQGDYIALQAYLCPCTKTKELLQRIRFELLQKTHLATTLGYGPRFLHSTGQLHKGGPNNGLFLQLVDEPETDLPIPEAGYSFGTLIKAQALGDYHALKSLGRRVLRVNLKSEVMSGLERLAELTRSA